MSSRNEQPDPVAERRTLANPRRLRASAAAGRGAARDRREPDASGPDHRPA